METQQTLDLEEPMTAVIRFRAQPSLLAVFRERCQELPSGPLDPSEVMRRLVVAWIKDGRQISLL